MDYNRLIAEHENIDALCATLAGIVANSTPDAEAALAVRTDLVALLTEHLAHEDSFLYPRMIGGANAKAAELARHFVAEFADLICDWRQYLDEWGSDCIEQDWETFCSETVSILARVRVRVARETSVIYPAALQCGAVSLKPMDGPATA